ncbi:MAG: stress-induced morphogen [Candidatus Azotimanducaceae bacterium]|jgi:stress-induced morphogen
MKLLRSSVLLTSLCLLISCMDSEEQKILILEAKLVDSSLSRLRVFSVHQNKAAIIEAQNLQQVVSDFLTTADDEHLQKVQSAWQASHNKYLQSHYGLFVPSDERKDLIFAIESWPIQPGFIDSLPDYPESGIVNDTTLSIDLSTLRQQHGITDREEVCLGYHAIEFLIFDRSIEHFNVQTKQENLADQSSIERRRLLLQLLADELVNNLSQSALLMDQQFSAEADFTGQDKIYHFLSSAAAYLQGVQRESSLLFDLNAGHGHYSKTSFNALAIELTALEAFFLRDVDFMPILMAIDLTTSANFKKTLLDAVALIRDPEAGEAEFAKLPLMISALGHQLENFESILGRNL